MTEPSGKHKPSESNQTPTAKLEKVTSVMTAEEYQLASEYDTAFDHLLRAHELFIRSATDEFLPRFNARVKQKWVEEEPVDRDGHKLFASWITSQLDQLGVSLRDPKTHRPSSLIVIGEGRYRLVPSGMSTGKESVNLLKFLPFQFCSPTQISPPQSQIR